MKFEFESISAFIPSFLFSMNNEQKEYYKWMAIRRKSDQHHNLSQHTQISYTRYIMINWKKIIYSQNLDVKLKQNYECHSINNVNFFEKSKLNFLFRDFFFLNVHLGGAEIGL